MAERTRSDELLKVALETCSAAHKAIMSSGQLGQPPDPLPPLSVIRKDLLSLLAFVFSSTTKIAIALKPSSPTYSAAITPLGDLIKHVAALSHCVRLFSPDQHGSTFSQEAIDVVVNIILSLQVLLKTLSETSHDEYLAKTGAVHALIDSARGPNGLSTDNLSGVRRKWNEDTGSLDDGARELKELIDNNGDGDEDDVWDELGLGSDAPLSEQEHDRATKIHSVLRLSAQLHKKVSSDILVSNAPDCRTPAHTVLDVLPTLSRNLLSAADELIAASQSPQDISSLTNDLRDFKTILREIQTSIDCFFPDASLENQLEELSLRDGDKEKQTRSKNKIWFDNRFDLLDKGIKAVELSLTSSEEP